MTSLRLFCGGDQFAAKAVTSLSGFLLLHQPKVYRPGTRGEFSLGRKNKNGRSRPHVNIRSWHRRQTLTGSDQTFVLILIVK